MYNRLPKLNFKYIAAPLFFSVLSCCAPLFTQPSPPFTAKKVEERISFIQQQEHLVQSVYYTGTIKLKKGRSENSAHVLVIGEKNPLTVKIEITHRWGRPLFHILLDQSTFHILSLTEKRAYSGNIKQLDKFGIIPRLDLPRIWTLARAYPILKDHMYAVSKKGDQITLLDGKQSPIQVLEFTKEAHLPSKDLDPTLDTRVFFLNHRDETGIFYAKRLMVSDPRNDIHIRMDIKKITFNRNIPEVIFKKEIPFDFITLPPQSIHMGAW